MYDSRGDSERNENLIFNWTDIMFAEENFRFLYIYNYPNFWGD